MYFRKLLLCTLRYPLTVNINLLYAQHTVWFFFIGIVVALFKSYEPDISTGTPSLKRRMEPIEMIDHQIIKSRRQYPTTNADETTLREQQSCQKYESIIVSTGDMLDMFSLQCGCDDDIMASILETNHFNMWWTVFRKGELNMHTCIHSGEKPYDYSVNVCGLDLTLTWLSSILGRSLHPYWRENISSCMTKSFEERNLVTIITSILEP